jgi:hypothetical protein
LAERRCTFKCGDWNCGSYQFNLYAEEIDQGSLCDVHYWQTKAQRPWVNLSDSQIETIYYETVNVHRGAPMPQGQVIFGRAVQAKLKEKNT